jgi:proline iminopeptidase
VNFFGKKDVHYFSNKCKVNSSRKMKFREMSLTIVMVVTFIKCSEERYIGNPGNLVPKTVNQDPSLPSIHVNGTQLHAEAFGNAYDPIIVVLHGGPGADYRSLLNCKEFANQGFRVVFYDQRGSGLSKRHNEDSYSLQIMYDDLSAIINNFRTSSAQKVFLLGHSWGAILATGYINKYPIAIDGAVIAEPGGLVYSDIVDYLDRARDINVTSELANDLSYLDQFITGNENEHEILDYKYALLAVADGDPGNPTGNENRPPFWRFGKVVADALNDIGASERPNFTTGLDQYATKILFVYSENNRAYGSQYAMKVSSAFPNVQLFKVNGAGHDVLTFQTGWNNFYPAALNYFNALK